MGPRFWRLPAAFAICVATVFCATAPATATPLPDGRAYEMVSPPNKGNSDVELQGTIHARGVAGADEQGYAFASLNGLPGSENGGLVTGNVAKRGPDGWSTTPVMPPDINQLGLMSAEPLLLSPDLNHVVVASRLNLTGDAEPGNNLYLRTLSPPSLRLITPTSPGETTWEPRYILGASEDFSRIFIQSGAPLTPDSPSLVFGWNLYEWDGSALRNVGTLPGETEPPSEGTTAILDQSIRAVSSDGTRVLFRAPRNSRTEVFLRDHGTPVEVSAPEPGVVDPNGPQEAEPVGAPADLSSVFFTSRAELTADAFTGEGSSGETDLAPNLYRYDVETGDLTDLTVDEADERGADVMFTHVLVAPTGGSAYFVAGGVLAAGAELGSPNLYRWSAANGIEFLATLAPFDPLVNPFAKTEAGTDHDGDAIAFVSEAGLTGESPVGVKEVYRWSTSEGLACVSCGGSFQGAQLPGPDFHGGGGGHPISEDGGKVFFSTADKLVAEDANGKMDAYEWEAGAVHLISTGFGEYPAEFLDASPSGKDVFFVTRARLVGADRDDNTDVYDAREGGGFPEPAETVPCEGEACRPPLEAAPPAPQLGSRSFQGPLNPKPRHHKKHRHHHPKKHRKCKAKAKKCPPKSRHESATGKRG